MTQASGWLARTSNNCLPYASILRDMEWMDEDPLASKPSPGPQAPLSKPQRSLLQPSSSLLHASEVHSSHLPKAHQAKGYPCEHCIHRYCTETHLTSQAHSPPCTSILESEQNEMDSHPSTGTDHPIADYTPVHFHSTFPYSTSSATPSTSSQPHSASASQLLEITSENLHCLWPQDLSPTQARNLRLRTFL